MAKCDWCSRAATEGGASFSEVEKRKVTYAACETHAKAIRLKFHASITQLVAVVQTELAL